MKPEALDELRYKWRCEDARSYARKLRQWGGHSSGINLIIKGIWGEKVADHVKSCQDNDYCLPDPEQIKR